MDPVTTATTVAGGISILNKFLDINSVTSDAELDNATESFLKANFMKTGSITKMLKTLVIEPTILVTPGAKVSPAYDNIVKVGLDMFSSFYLQAFDMLTKVSGVSTLTAISILSTNTVSGKGALTNKAKNLFDNLTAESLDKPLVLNQLDFNNSNIFFNLEANDGNELAGGLFRKLKVSIKLNNNSTIEVPINIIANVKMVKPEEIINVMMDKDAKNTFTSRWMEYKSGGISLSDLIFCTDLIKDYKSRKISKNSDLFNRLEDRNNDKYLRRIVTGIAGTEYSYGIVVTSEDELRSIESITKLNVSKFGDKEKLLSTLQSHNLSVLDDDTERARILISDLQGEMNIGYKKINNYKDSDNGMMDFMKYFIANKTPVF